jgi:hypothetical protein
MGVKNLSQQLWNNFLGVFCHQGMFILLNLHKKTKMNHYETKICLPDQLIVQGTVQLKMQFSPRRNMIGH